MQGFDPNDVEQCKAYIKWARQPRNKSFTSDNDLTRMRNMALAWAKRMTEICQWEEDGADDFWPGCFVGCANPFPSIVDFKFCPYCGHLIESVPFKETGTNPVKGLNMTVFPIKKEPDHA